MGVELAIGALSAGTSLMSNRAQNKAAKQGLASQERSTANEIATYERMFQQQRQDYEPFRQYEIQQANAMGELFGFDPVGQPGSAGGQPGRTHVPGLTIDSYNARRAGGGTMPQARAPGQFAMMGQNNFEPEMRASPGGFTTVRDGMGYQNSSMGAAMSLPGQNGAPVQNALDPNKLQTTPVVGSAPAASNVPAANAPGTQPLFDSALGGADRFNNSLFNPMAQTMFNTQRDNIDNNLAGQGLVYSSARQNAVQQAGVNSTQNALGMYLNALSGAPQMQATAAGGNAALNYGQQVGGAYQNQGAYQAQSAYNRGQNNANLWGNLGSAGAFAIGGK